MRPEVDMSYLEEKARAELGVPMDIDEATARAMKMYEVPAAEVTPEMKSTAQTLNYIDTFGGIYGKG